MTEIIKQLSENEIERVKKATEDILEKVGFRLGHPELLSRCRKAKAKVDEASGTVRIPAPLLRELLSQVPPAYTIVSSDGKEHRIGGENQFCQAIVTDPWIIDCQTSQPRRPCLADIRRHTVIGQKLPAVVAMYCMDFPVADVPGPASNLRALEEFICSNNKHILAVTASAESLQQYLEIARILLQGKELARNRLMGVAVAVVSPLVLSELNAVLLLTACQHNLEVFPTTCPMAGTTAPYSLAGTLLLGHTENIIVAALTQIVNPGNPFCYSLGPSVANLHSGHDLYYTLDKVLWKLGAVQLARSYRFPVACECGGTLTSRYDQQNGAEGMLFMLSAVASKANMLSGIGSCYNAVGMSAEMMLIHTAWLEAARFLNHGLAIDRERLAMENIKSAGPGGNFLTDDLTLKFMRGGEFFSSSLFDYSGDFGKGPPLLERAHQAVEELVNDCQSPLPGKVQEELHRYFHDNISALKKDRGREDRPRPLRPALRPIRV